MPGAPNGLVFEVNGASSGVCPSVVALDAATYAPLSNLGAAAPGCAGADIASPGTSTGNSKQPLFIIDHRDHLVLTAQGDSVTAYSEAPPFRTMGTWSLFGAPNAQLTMQGISWSEPDDTLIVTMSNSNVGSHSTPLGPPGMSVIAIGIPQSLQAGSPDVLWSTLVQQCVYALDPEFATSAAYESALQPAVYVPCELPGAPEGQSGLPEKDGVVTLQLAQSSASNPCNQGVALCPDGATSVAVAPAQITDFMFDPGSDRGFSTAVFSGTTNVLVYDGRQDQFVGRTDLGSSKSVVLGLDTTTGRVYAIGGDGLTIIDGRLTPVPVGTKFPQYTANVDYVSVGVLPPTPDHPYARVPIPHSEFLGGPWPYYDVYADAIPIPQQPNPANADANTHSGPIAPGAQLAVTANGSASGYGTHYDMVGGPAAATNNLLLNQTELPSCVPQIPQPIPQPPVHLPCQPLPFEYGNRDLLAGSVAGLSIDSGFAQGTVSALQPGDTGTASGYNSTTNGNQWPFPPATCSYPGGTASMTYDGSYYGSDPTNPQRVPGSDASTAHATDNCNSNGGATAAAWYGGGPAAVSGFPDISIGHSESSASITPGSATAGTTSTTTSSAEGMHIVMPGGVGSVDIGRASATATATAAGTAGSATATYQSTVSQVSMTVAGTTLSLCPSVCSNVASVIDEINNAFPTFIHIIQPQPDPTYYHDKSGNPIASGQGYGTPGGYEALVQASLAEQTGDQKFNGMTFEESTILPALRVVTYSPQDGDPNQSRQIVDLAGVEAGADQGIQPIAPGGQLGVTTQQALCAAGGCNPATSEYIAGTAGTPGTPGTPGTSGGGPLGGLGRALGGAVERLFGGLQWLARNPLDALQMLGFLGLLGAPFLLMDRRRIWVRNILMRAH
ncbi:MAG: hypothetical protein ACYDAC_00030 [Candidatus Dormibacteria bacterium]